MARLVSTQAREFVNPPRPLVEKFWYSRESLTNGYSALIFKYLLLRESQWKYKTYNSLFLIELFFVLGVERSIEEHQGASGDV